MSRRATVVGVGLIGGSIGMALREAGWHVSGVDAAEAGCTRGLEVGAPDGGGGGPGGIKELDDSEALGIALLENVQRGDLTAIEEAEGYPRPMDEVEHTQEALARAIGKSRSHIANLLRLLTLPEPVKQMVNDGALSAGHARALLTADDPTTLAGQVVKQGLNVRQTEKLAQDKGRKKKREGGKKERVEV